MAQAFGDRLRTCDASLLHDFPLPGTFPSVCTQVQAALLMTGHGKRRMVCQSPLYIDVTKR